MDGGRKERMDTGCMTAHMYVCTHSWMSEGGREGWRDGWRRTDDCTHACMHGGMGWVKGGHGWPWSAFYS